MNSKGLALIGSLASGCHAGSGAGGGGSDSDGSDGGETTAPVATTAPESSDSGHQDTDAGTTTTDPADSSDGGSDTGEPDDYPTDPLDGLPDGEDQHDALCSRSHGDPISQAFCATPDQPTIGSLVELENFIGLDMTNPASTSFALTSHSSSLVMRLVSPLNPRAIMFTRPLGGQPRNGNPLPNPQYVALGFTRGEQFVELVAKDTTADDQLRFFLFKFESGCNADPAGCNPGDLFTPAVEQGFTGYTLYEDVDIANTIFDCKQCHQPQGPDTEQLLRMQELQFPWTHWLFDEPEGDVMLCADFRAAHTDEDYAGIPALNYATGCRAPQGTFAGPPALENFVENNGFIAQPNQFITNLIMDEVIASNPAQPAINVPPGQSATWDGLYDAYLSATAIPPPYHDFRVTDAQKLSDMTDAYTSMRNGTLAPDELPDISDVFLDAALPDMTIAPRPGATGEEILNQMCIQCHNSRLDQSISRADFNVEHLEQMSAAEKAIAIQRLTAPKDSAKLMPPRRFRGLTDAEIELAVAVLEQ
jgi:mono/diheme cytochrome c family protein